MKKMGQLTPKSLEENHKRKMHINAIIKKRSTVKYSFNKQQNRCLTEERYRGGERIWVSKQLVDWVPSHLLTAKHTPGCV